MNPGAASQSRDRQGAGDTRSLSRAPPLRGIFERLCPYEPQ